MNNTKAYAAQSATVSKAQRAEFRAINPSTGELVKAYQGHSRQEVDAIPSEKFVAELLDCQFPITDPFTFKPLPGFQEQSWRVLLRLADHTKDVDFLNR
jgi:hypothetical protein